MLKDETVYQAGYKAGYKQGVSDTRKKNRERTYRNWDKTLAEMDADPNHRYHGMRMGYTVGCRCDRCIEAQREYSREYYKKRKEKKNDKDNGAS